MDSKLQILQHSLGVNQYGQGNQYRNHFVTGPKTTDWPHCMALVSEGLMQRHAPSALTGGSDCFTVTDAGRAYVAEHSPKPPKLTQGQQRYRAWLRADCGLKFGEWLKDRPRAV
jgi:hypothetical protein